MWLFDPTIARRRSNVMFYLGFKVHKDPTLLNRLGTTHLTDNPLMRPLANDQRAEVMVNFTDHFANVRDELHALVNLKQRPPIAGKKLYMVVRGSNKGKVGKVKSVKDDEKTARFLEEGKTDTRKDGLTLKFKDLNEIKFGTLQ